MPMLTLLVLVLVLVLFGPAFVLAACGLLFGRKVAVAVGRHGVVWLYGTAILVTGAELARWTFVIGVEETGSGPAHFAHTVIAGLLILSAGFAWLAVRIPASESKRESRQAAIP